MDACIIIGLACIEGGLCVRDAISDRGALGRRIPPREESAEGGEEVPSRRGGIENACTAGELKDDGGPDGGRDPFEYTDTFSSQSLVAPFPPAPDDKLDDVLDTDALL